MAATANKKRGRTQNRRRSLAPKRWRSILCAIPGYDPFRDAEGCWFDPRAAQYYLDFIETCCTHIFKAGACFGLTPADLSGVRAVEKPPADDGKAKFFERTG